VAVFLHPHQAPPPPSPLPGPGTYIDVDSYAFPHPTRYEHQLLRLTVLLILFYCRPSPIVPPHLRRSEAMTSLSSSFASRSSRSKSLDTTSTTNADIEHLGPGG
jgi:hypothetical protein